MLKKNEKEQKAIKRLEKMRWNGKPRCVYCFSAQVSTHAEQQRRNRLQCSKCKKSFSVTTGTIFHGTHVDLNKWFKLIDIMNHTDKITVAEISKKIKVRAATAWSMMKRVKKSTGLIVGDK